MTSVNASLVRDAVMAALRAEFNFPVGDMEAPDPGDDARNELTKGWLTVNTVPTGANYQGGGYVGQSESIETIRFQLKATGTQRNQADRICSAAVAALVDRSDDGPPFEHITPLAIAGHTVMNRRKAGMIPDEVMGGKSVGALVDIQVTVS